MGVQLGATMSSACAAVIVETRVEERLITRVCIDWLTEIAAVRHRHVGTDDNHGCWTAASCHARSAKRTNRVVEACEKESGRKIFPGERPAPIKHGIARSLQTVQDWRSVQSDSKDDQIRMSSRTLYPRCLDDDVRIALVHVASFVRAGCPQSHIITDQVEADCVTAGSSGDILPRTW